LSGAIITALLLLSISFFYLEFFTFNFDSVSYIFLNSDSSLISDVAKFRISNLQKLFFLLTISIFLFKLGAFPFHFYLGDIYEALDFKKTMFLYTIPLKLIIFFTLLKFLTNFWFIGLSLFDLIMCSGVGSLFISSFTALTQVKLKRF
jgi:NADH-quinone oxidoreductase subunit N